MNQSTEPRALSPAQMAIATAAVATLLNNLPADRIEVTDQGVVVETANPITFVRWASAIGVRLVDEHEATEGPFLREAIAQPLSVRLTREAA